MFVMIVIGDEMKKVVFFGDSVTEAHRNIKNHQDLGQGFVFSLQNIYQQVSFHNKGIGGQRIKDLLVRVDEDVISLEPDLCFIWIGVNDAWLPYLLGFVSSFDTFKHDYDGLIKHIQNKCKKTKLILIKPYVLPIGHVSLEIHQDVDRYRVYVDDIAKQFDLDVIDIKEEIEKQLVIMSGEHLFYDGIHPTPEGYQLITTVLDRYLKGLNL
jgi:lysophospholipase L1-like esterase